MESIHTKAEQNSKAILGQLRDEADHSKKKLEMSLVRTRVIVIQHRRQHMALACITCTCRYDLANYADSCHNKSISLHSSSLLGCEKNHDPENVLSRPTTVKTRLTAIGNGNAQV